MLKIPFSLSSSISLFLSISNFTAILVTAATYAQSSKLSGL